MAFKRLTEAVHIAPDEAAYVKALTRVAQPVFGFRRAIVDLHAETA